MRKVQRNNAHASIEIVRNENLINVLIKGSFKRFSNKDVLSDLLSEINDKIQKVNFIDEGILDWDSSLPSVIFQIILFLKDKNIAYFIDKLPRNLQKIVELAFSVQGKNNADPTKKEGFFERIGRKFIYFINVTAKVLDFCFDVFGSLGKIFSKKSVMRSTDFLSALDDCGPKAIAIVSLISFLVGLILAFVGAVQLKEFGAQIYVASLVTIGMCRIMGAIMVGIIMAGRTGSSYAATIGTMQVNEELDALQTMGFSRIDFLVTPRLLALLISMPILTMLADIMGMIGGGFVGVTLMGLPLQEYWKYSSDAFNLTNFLIGIFHGFCFGFIIALCGCYQGLNCGRNADSVGVATTQSVVYAIVWMIIATGIITVICQGIGL